MYNEEAERGPPLTAGIGFASDTAFRFGVRQSVGYLICILVIAGTTSTRFPQKEMNMADLPFPWCVYAEHQSNAARCGRLTDRSWGIENGLTNFLSAVESNSVPTDQAEFRRSLERAA